MHHLSRRCSVSAGRCTSLIVPGLKFIHKIYQEMPGDGDAEYVASP